VKHPCPFCLTKGTNSAEHRLPDSWEQYFTVPRVLLNTSVINGVHKVSINNKSPFDLKFGGICASCNNGWMREIDEAAREDVIPFATSEISSLEVEAADRIAMHLVRTALMTSWGKRDQQGYPAHLFNEFYRRREVPNGVRVFVGTVDTLALVAGETRSSPMRTRR
jgi:hypothetical protein